MAPGSTVNNAKYSTEIINQICQSKGLLEAADYLNQFIVLCKAIPDNTISLIDLKQSIRTHVWASKSTFLIGRDATLLFLDLHLDTQPDIEGLEELVSYVHQHFTVADTQSIGEEQINRMLSLIKDRLPIVGKEFSRDPIQFGLLANTHKLYNSFYLCNIWLGGMIYDAIMLTSPLPGFGCAQEFTLLHELGHAAHARLTRNIKIIPESFMELFCDIFYQYPESIEEAAELFADFFAFAASIGTPLEEENPLSVLCLKKKNKIVRYFKLLFK